MKPQVGKLYWVRICGEPRPARCLAVTKDGGIFRVTLWSLLAGMILERALADILGEAQESWWYRSWAWLVGASSEQAHV